MSAPKKMMMMDCSTGHLSLSTREWIDEAISSEEYGFMSRDTGYAMSSWMGDEEHWVNHPGVPRDLIHVLRYAKANKMEWVLFDSDADRDVNLPWYDDARQKPVLPKGIDEAILVMDSHGVVAVDPEKLEIKDLIFREDEVLDDENYVIPDDQGVWLAISGTAIRVRGDGEGNVAITTFVNGYEMNDPLSQMWFTEEDISGLRAAFEEEENPPESSM